MSSHYVLGLLLGPGYRVAAMKKTWSCFNWGRWALNTQTNTAVITNVDNKSSQSDEQDDDMKNGR